MASQLGSMIEVRVGSRTQDLPIFVRMLDKDSTWVNLNKYIDHLGTFI